MRIISFFTSRITEIKTSPYFFVLTFILSSSLLLFFILFPLPSSAQSYCEGNEYCRVNVGEEIEVDTCSWCPADPGCCRVVMNDASFSDAADTFVPIKTCTEWAEFKTHRPAHIWLSECGVPTYTLFVQSVPVGIPIDGINTNYDESHSAGIAVSKTAPATHGIYAFSNWSGCDSVSGTGNRTCNVTMNSDKLTTAYYDDQGTCGQCRGGAGCEPRTTFWLAGTHGCAAYNVDGKGQRCVNGVCRACAGESYWENDPSWPGPPYPSYVENAYLYNDGCDGCANQGGLACWRAGYDGTAAESCNGVCSSYDGCVAENWNDDLSRGVQSHWADCGSGYDNWNWSAAPAFHGSACVHRLSTLNQDCAQVDECWARVCVCLW